LAKKEDEPTLVEVLEGIKLQVEGIESDYGVNLKLLKIATSTEISMVKSGLK
jgi:hypothetical protein